MPPVMSQPPATAQPEHHYRRWVLAVAVALIALFAPFLGSRGAEAQEPGTTVPVEAGAPSDEVADVKPCPPPDRPDKRSIYGQLCVQQDGESSYADGVTITASLDGKVVGKATTDDKGLFIIPVSDSGTYVVRLDAKTLPNGVKLADEEKTELDQVRVLSGAKPVQFPLGGADSSGIGADSGFPSLFASGLKFGLVVAVASVGLSLIFGVTGLVNFAHGELVTFGALAAYVLNSMVGGPRIAFVLAAVAAVALSGGLGWVLDAGLWAPLRRRRSSLVSMMVVSIGLSLLLRHVFQLFFGPDRRPYRSYTLQRNVSLGPFPLPPKDWWIVGISIVVLAGVVALLKFTRLGTSVRAVADNKDLAASSGIDVRRVVRISWVLGSALAGLGGVLYGLTQTVSFDMGFLLLLTMFAAIVLGGLGSAQGAIFGGIVIGLVTDVSTLWISPDLKLVCALMVLIIVLLFRPQGILGTKERLG